MITIFQKLTRILLFVANKRYHLDYVNLYCNLSEGEKKIIVVICEWHRDPKGKYPWNMAWFSYLGILTKKLGALDEKTVESKVNDLVSKGLLSKYTNETNPQPTHAALEIEKLSKETIIRIIDVLKIFT